MRLLAGCPTSRLVLQRCLLKAIGASIQEALEANANHTESLANNVGLNFSKQSRLRLEFSSQACHTNKASVQTAGTTQQGMA